MRQGWVVSVLDTAKKEIRYRLVWGTEEEAEKRVAEWWEKFKEKGYGARFRIKVSFPTAQYEQGDFRDIRVFGPSREALTAICEPFDTMFNDDPDVPGGFIIEVYRDDMRDLLDALEANPDVESSRIIPDLGKLIDEAAEIKRQLDSKHVAESA